MMATSSLTPLRSVRIGSSLASSLGLEFGLESLKLRFESLIPLLVEFVEAIDEQPVDELGLLTKLFLDGFVAHFCLERCHAICQ